MQVDVNFHDVAFLDTTKTNERSNPKILLLIQAMDKLDVPLALLSRMVSFEKSINGDLPTGALCMNDQEALSTLR